MRAHGPRSGLALRLALPALLATSAMRAEPIRTELDETIEAHLHVRLIRIEPTKPARAGECLDLTPEELDVRLRGERVLPDGLDIDRKRPPTLHALLIDTSASMVKDLPYAKYAAAEYVKQLRPEYEKALVATFDENVVLWQGVTANRDRLLAAVDGVRMGGQTSLLDAVYYTLSELDAHRQRPVLILLSDGADTASIYDVEDVLGQLVDKPGLTVFTIGLGLQVEHGHKPTRNLLARLASSTNGRFFDVAEGSRLENVFAEIRSILENEAVLTVVDPDPGVAESPMRVRSRKPSCRITVLDEGEGETPGDPRPSIREIAALPQVIAFAPTVEYAKLYTQSAKRSADPACSVPEVLERAAAEGGWFEPTWFVRVESGSIGACGPDLILEPGPLYSPDAEGILAHNAVVSVRTRPFAIDVPPLGELPGRPAQVMDGLGRLALTLAAGETGIELTRRPPGDHARPHYDYPMLAHGVSLLGMRARIAWALFMHPEYREWARGKLGEDAERELAVLQQRYLQRFPGLPADRLAEAVRYSADGQGILSRAVAPTEDDLQPYLAAWLGDLPAHALFIEWERERLNHTLTESASVLADERLFEAWRELRRVFFVPSYARILTVLVPVHDVDCDCIGFWRVVLPRPSWLYPRLLGLPEEAALAAKQLDLVADMPFGFWLIDQSVRREPGLLDYLRQAGYRATAIDYELIGEPATRHPLSAYRQTRVTVILEAEPGQAGTVERSFELRAELRLDEAAAAETSAPVVETLSVSVSGDPRLSELAHRARSSMLASFGQPGRSAAETR
jgi:hypothetical protein